MVKNGGHIDGCNKTKFDDLGVSERFVNSSEGRLTTRAQRNSARKKERYATNERHGRYSLDINLKTGGIFLHQPTIDAQKTAAYLKRGLENGLELPYVESLLRNFLQEPECGNFAISKLNYPTSKILHLSVEKYPPTPEERLSEF